MANPDEFATRLLGETREEIIRSDTKASILLAGAGVAIAAGGGAFASARLTLGGERGVVQCLVVAAGALLVLGVFALGVAVYPRLKKGTPGEANYFMDYVEYVDDPDGLRKVIEKNANDTVTRDVHQLLALSPIVRRKYRATRWGEVLIGLGIVAGVASLVLHVTMTA